MKTPIEQPDFLKTDDEVLWCWGKGNDVWAMFEASSAGDIESLTKLTEQAPNLVRCQCDYRKPLHFAVIENQLESVKFLIDRGADATYFAGQKWHDSPPVLAADRGFVAMQEFLEQYRLEQFGICPAGDEIADAFQDRDEARTNSLIDEHGVDAADERGNKPLHWAVMTRQIPLIDLILKKGADINAIRPDGARPLDLTNGDYWYRGWRDSHADSIHNHWPLIGYLIARGAEYDLTTACRIGDIERVREIVEENPQAANENALYETWYSGYPLRSAAKAGHIEIVRFLLDHGADPNKPEHGLAPFGGALYDSAQNGHFEVLKLLLDRGGDANQVVESSGCVLSAATSDEMRELLRYNGAIYDPYGCWYFGIADDFAIQCERNPFVANDSAGFAMVAEKGHKKLVEIFLKYQPDMWSRMPAHLGETSEITDWMVASGMNVNATNWLGIHQLHHGCDGDSLSTWIKLGVDLNVIDGEYQSTPLGWAASRGDLEFAKLLLENGADPNLAGEDWATPLAWSQRRNHGDLEQLLRK